MKKALILGLLIGAICAPASTEIASWDYGPDPHGVVVQTASWDYGPGEPHGIVKVASWDYGPGPHSIVTQG